MKYHVGVIILILFFGLSCVKKNNNTNTMTESKASSLMAQNTPELLSLDSFVGKWMLINPDGGFYTDQYLLITKNDDKYILNGKYQKFIYSGNLQKKGDEFIFTDPINGTFSLCKIHSKDKALSGGISLNLIGAGEDILCGYYQNIVNLDNK